MIGVRMPARSQALPKAAVAAAGQASTVSEPAHEDDDLDAAIDRALDLE